MNNEQFRADVRALCEARDFAQFSDLPKFIKDPLFRLLDQMGPACGYVEPKPQAESDGFIIGGTRI